MLIFYVDEVGNGNLGTNSIAEHPWFILGAMGIRDVNRRSIAKALGVIKQQYFGPVQQTQTWGNTEIKGRYLAQAAKRLSNGKPPLKPIGYQTLTSDSLDRLVDSLFRLYRTFSPVLYAIGVDKQRHLSIPRRVTYDPIAIAYAYLQQRLAMLVEHTSSGEEGILMLADEQKEHENLFRNGQVSSVRQNLQARMHKAPDIGAIIAKPVWIDSDEMVVDREVAQLADFMLYSVRYGMVEGNWYHPWLEKLGPHFARHWGANKTIGAVWNAGITIYPRIYYRRIQWAEK